MTKQELLEIAKKISEKKATPEEKVAYMEAVKEELKAITKILNDGNPKK